MIYNRRLHSIQYDCLLHTTGSLIMYNRRPEYIYIQRLWGFLCNRKVYYIQQNSLLYIFMKVYIYVYSSRPHYIQQEASLYMKGGVIIYKRKPVGIKRKAGVLSTAHPVHMSISSIYLCIVIHLARLGQASPAQARSAWPDLVWPSQYMSQTKKNKEINVESTF